MKGSTAGSKRGARGAVWLGLSQAPPPIPASDRLNDLFTRYKKALGLKDKDVGEKLGMSEGYVRQKRHKGTDCWTVADVRQMCEVLNITDPMAVGEAILRIKK